MVQSWFPSNDLFDLETDAGILLWMGTSMVFAMVNFINLFIYHHNIPILAVPIHYSSASDLLPQLCDHAEQDLVLYLLYQPVHSQPRSITRIFTHILRSQGWDVVCDICIKIYFRNHNPSNQQKQGKEGQGKGIIFLLIFPVE